MASFRRPSKRADLRLFGKAPVAFVYAPAEWEPELGQIRKLGYRVELFDCSQWSSDADLKRDLGARLGCDDPGHTLESLSSCLSDQKLMRVPTRSGGLVLALQGFDHFFDVRRSTALALLDACADAGWWHLLFGRRLFTLVLSRDLGQQQS